MKIYRDESLKNFEAWGGAKEVLRKMIKKDVVDEFECLIEECYPDGLTETELNDILWFEDELTAEYIGEWELINCKIIKDFERDDEITIYKWYKRDIDGLHIFTTDEEPDRNWADWEAWTDEEAKEWFENYGKEESEEYIVECKALTEEEAREWFENYGKEV